MDDDSNEYYLMTHINGGQTDRPDRRTERRGSQTVRSELSDTLRRVNNQEASRLQVIGPISVLGDYGKLARSCKTLVMGKTPNSGTLL